MNRKLVNGLLLLSVFTVGCGTFTSCKDNEEDYKNEIILSFQEQLKKAIDEVKCTCDKDLVNAMRQFLDMTSDAPYSNNKGYKNIYDLIAGYLKEKGATLDFQLEDGTYTTLGAQIARIDTLEENYNDLLIKVLNNQASIETLQAQLNNLITSMEVSQAYNHIFGTLNLPVGVQSNILAAYYGVSAASVSFPNDLAKTEVGGAVSEEDMIKIATSASNPVSVEAGVNYMDETEEAGNLGQLYMTMNPAEKDFTGASLSLINSNGEEAPVTLTAAKNDELLTFGWTRTDNLFGLYRVDASIDPAQAEEIAPNIQDGLANAFKNALSGADRANLVNLAKVLLDQLNGFLPAYAVKANTQYTGTTVDDNNEFVNSDPSNQYIYSKFEIAATAVKPLGFEFLADVHSSKKLPTYGPVSDAIESYLNELKKKATISFEGVEFEIGKTEITVKLNGAVDAEGKAIEDIVLGYDPAKGKVTTGNADALNPAFSDLVDSVNGLLADLEANVNNQISDIVKDIENKLLGKASTADKLLNKYNQLAGTVNNFLANPNSALQVMLAYEAKDGNIHRVSTDANQPTVVKKGGVVSLLPTTNTAEIVAPAYKKLVSVISANKANVNGASLNTVIPGRQHKVGFSASQAGLYKVAYSALDFRGKTSTKVYYIQVVD